MVSKPPCFDEMLNEDGTPRAAYAAYHKWFTEQDSTHLKQKAREAEEFFRRTGITFNVYGDDEAEERLIPFDIIPRIITARRMAQAVARDRTAGARASMPFCTISTTGRKSSAPVACRSSCCVKNEAFLPQMIGFTPPGGVYTHIVGIDLVRTGPDEFMVLEDNARTPSGVSYMLENRETMMDDVPELFTTIRVRTVQDYPKNLRACAQPRLRRRPAPATPVVAVLTPGIYNSRLFRTCLSGRPDGRRTGRRPATCASSTAGSRCAPPAVTSRSMCSTAGSMMITSIR